MLPRALTSLYSRTYTPLFNGVGGRAARSCAASFSVNGVTVASQGVAIGANAGSVGRHSPGPLPPTKTSGLGGKLPSPVLTLIMAAAALGPILIPASPNSPRALR